MNDKHFNPELCQERHEFITRKFDDTDDKINKAEAKMDARIKKVENRFLIIMTILVSNLIGVICTLGVLLVK